MNKKIATKTKVEVKGRFSISVGFMWRWVVLGEYHL